MDTAVNNGGVPWWVWLLIIVVLVALFFWWWCRRPKGRRVESAMDETSFAVAAPAERKEAVPSEATVSAAPEPAAPAVPAEQELPSSERSDEPDDLTRIEPIGPKISSLCQAAGISTFARLAATDVDRTGQLGRCWRVGQACRSAGGAQGRAPDLV